MNVSRRRLFHLSLACMLIAAATATTFRILLRRQESEEHVFERPGPIAVGPAGAVPAPVLRSGETSRITCDDPHVALYQLAGTYLPEAYFSNEVGLQPIFVECAFSRPRAHFESDAFARQCLLDPFQTELRRCDALYYLNGSGPSRLDLQVIRSAVVLLETSPDPEVRADLCWGLVAVPEPEAIDALLRRLASDVDERVRLQAVIALVPSRKAAGPVDRALEHAAYHDASEAVRAWARRAKDVAEPMEEDK
jgi:hypothetical protein